MNRCLKLLEVQYGPETVRSSCSDGSIGVDIGDACGLREKKYSMLCLKR